MNYLSYEPEDFATDDFFHRWVQQPDAETESFWQDWLRTYPHKAHDVVIARQLVLIVATDSDATPSEQVINKMWHTIQTGRQSGPNVVTHPATRIRFLGAFRIAAAIALLLLAAGGFYFWQTRTISYATAYGESQRIRLPDGSVVDLNAHSTLNMRAHWQEAANREVWITGEAFFAVSKQQRAGKPVKFVVHTNDLDIEVKGTQFNVNTRQQQTKVVLSEGYISLLLNNRQASRSVQMKPGDAVVFSKEKQKLAVAHLTNPQATHSWTNSRWTLNDSSLQEVATLIEETYGMPVRFQQDSLKTLNVNGVIPTDSLTDLLNTLESILDIKIDRQADQLIIRTMP